MSLMSDFFAFDGTGGGVGTMTGGMTGTLTTSLLSSTQSFLVMNPQQQQMSFGRLISVRGKIDLSILVKKNMTNLGQQWEHFFI